MRAIFLSLLSSLALTAPSAAEITDLRARLDGDAGQIWIAFDEQPTGVTSEVTETGLVLSIEGVAVRGRSISPATDTLVAAVSVDPTDSGGVLQLYASRSWTGARAELRQGGVLVSLTAGPAPHVDVRIADGAAAMTPEAETRPAPAQISDAAAHAQDEMPGASDPMTAPTPAPAAEPGPAREPASQPAPASGAPTDLFTRSDSAAAAARNGSSVVPPGVCVEQAQAVAASPWDDDLLHAQAACLSGADFLAPAASIYEQMLAFEPDNFRATVALAEIRVEQGDNQAARALYDQAASHAISDAEAARARARLRDLREP